MGIGLNRAKELRLHVMMAQVSSLRFQADGINRLP
jgi:hypothetical protein